MHSSSIGYLEQLEQDAAQLQSKLKGRDGTLSRVDNSISNNKLTVDVDNQISLSEVSSEVRALLASMDKSLALSSSLTCKRPIQDSYLTINSGEMPPKTLSVEPPNPKIDRRIAVRVADGHENIEPGREYRSQPAHSTTQSPSKLRHSINKKSTDVLPSGVTNVYPLSLSNSSASILKHVFQSQQHRHSDNQPLVQTVSYTEESKALSDSKKFVDEAFQIGVTMLGPPPSDGPIETTISYFTQHLNHQRQEVRFVALHALRDLLSRSSAVTVDIGAPIAMVIELYESQDEKITILATIVAAEFGVQAIRPCVPAFIKILRDNKCSDLLHFTVVNAIICVNRLGVECVIDAALDSIEVDGSRILSLLARQPSLQQLIILPIILKDMESSIASRRETAILVFHHLRGCGGFTTAMPLILDALVSGSANRTLTASAIRSTGKAGERILIHLLERNQNQRVRCAVAEALGDPLLELSIQTPLVCLRPSAEMMGCFMIVESKAMENVNISIADLDDSDVNSYDSQNTPTLNNSVLLFDLRAFVSAVREACSVGLFDNVRVLALESLSTINILYEASTFNEKYKYCVPSQECVASLVNALADVDADVRASAACSLGKCGLIAAHPAIPFLAATLGDRDSKVREQAAFALGRLGPEVSVGCIDALMRMVKDEFYSVRYAACCAIGSLKQNGCPALPLLVKCLLDGSIQRSRVAATICSLGTDGEYTLSRILGFQTSPHSNTQVRTAAAMGLAHANITSSVINNVVDALLCAGNDRIPLVRRAVLDTLMTLYNRAEGGVPSLRDQNLMPFFYSFLKDCDKTVRHCAAKLLVRVGAFGEVLVMEAILKDSNSLIRAAAAVGLASVGPRMVRPLLVALNDKDPNVRKAVSECLMALNVEHVIVELKSQLQSQQDSVIIAANQILQSPYPYPINLKQNIIMIIEALQHMHGNE